MKRTILSILLALAFSLTLLAAAIYLPATSDWLMLRLMTHYAPPEDTYLPEAEYPAVTEMITDYLSNRTDTFQHVFTVDGTEYTAFNTKEQQHMADVQGLFFLCKVIAWIGAGVVVFVGFVFHKHMTWRICRRTLIGILAAITAVIVLAAIDFNSLFILFHQLAFTNDLWLLDPRTDLLIRLMPIEFFVSYAAIIGGIWLLGMVAMLIFTSVRIRKNQTNERV